MRATLAHLPMEAWLDGGSTRRRVVRGGCWDVPPGRVRSASPGPRPYPAQRRDCRHSPNERDKRRKNKEDNDFLRRFFFVRRACLLSSLQKSGVVFYEIDRIACRSKNGRTEICPALPIIERTRLSDHAYGIYFFHFVFVLWLQYMLLDLLLIAPLKAAIVIAGALLLSWAASTMTGQIVLPRRVSNPRPRSASLG
jgi:hypothetical protein